MIKKVPEYQIKGFSVTLIGNSFLEDANYFYFDFINFLKSFVINKKRIILNFKLDYYNTLSTRYISAILILLKNMSKNYDITINWYYLSVYKDIKNFDEDMKELGENYKESLDIPMNILPR